MQVIIILREIIYGKMFNMEELHAVGSEGPSTKVKEILQNKVVNVSSKDEQGKTALHYACQKGQFEIVKNLINRGADINIQTISKKTPLHLATERGSQEIVNFLLSKGASVNAKTNFGTQPLHTAAENGYYEIAETLIDHGAEIGCKIIDHNLTQLLLAVKNKNTYIAEMLLKQGANPNHQIGYVTPLTQAIKNQDVEMIKILVKNGVDPNLDLIDRKIVKSKYPVEYKSVWEFESNEIFGGGTPLFTAIRTDNFEIIKYLVEQGADVNARRNLTQETPMTLAIQRTCLFKNLRKIDKCKELEQIVKLMVENGYDMKFDANNTKFPLIAVMSLKMTNLAEYLIKKGANLNAIVGDKPLLFWALFNRLSKIARILIEKGANVHHKLVKGFDPLEIGCTPLHAACHYGNLGLVKILVDKGVDINAKDITHSTPLHYALNTIHFKKASKMKTLIAYFLIKKGSDVDCFDDSNMTPLIYAVKNGQLELVKILVQKGAKVEAGPDYYGRNLLFNTVEVGNFEIAKCLVENGANLNFQETTFGNTPLHVAIKKQSMEIIQLLLDNGADLNLKNQRNQTPLDLQKSICYDQEILDKIIQKMIKDKENSEIAEESRAKRFKFEDCVICYEPRHDMFVLNPCGHAKTCEACCIKILHLHETNMSCPVCREKVTSYVKADF